MSIIDPTTGQAMRSETHEVKLGMLFEWLTQEPVLEAILKARAAAYGDLVRLTALLSATISTEDAGTDGAPGITEQAAGEFIHQFLGEPTVLWEVARFVAEAYGIEREQAEFDLTAMRDELAPSMPTTEAEVAQPVVTTFEEIVMRGESRD